MNKTDMEFYGTYLPLLEETEQILQKELTRINNEILKQTEHSPAEHVRSRIKSAKSMQQKLKKRGYDPSPKNAILQLTDAVGIRIVTHFVGDVYSILERLKLSGSFRVTEIKDYIANPKKNGYRSLHVIVEIPFQGKILPSVQAEIQLRTIAMDCWASLEHQLKYKKTIKNAALIEQELKRCANEMASTDLTMQTIKEMISEKDENDETIICGG